MRFSIITSEVGLHLNQLNRLKRSLNRQTDLTFEWIIVCGNSSLNVSNSKFGIIPVKVGPNLSIGEQLSKTITGDFAIFVSAHDVLRSTAIQNLRNVILLCRHRNVLIYDLNLVGFNSYGDGCFDYSDLISNRNFKYLKWLKNRFWVYQYENKYLNLGQELLLDGKVIPRKLIMITAPLFKQGLDGDSNLNFMLQNLELADGVVQLSSSNGNCVVPPLNRNLSQWLIWIRACFESLLNLRDQVLISTFIRYFIVRIDHSLYPALMSNDKPVLKTRILVEVQKFLQLIDPNSFDVLENRRSQLHVLSRQILSLIKRGNFVDAEKLMTKMPEVRRSRQWLSRKLSDWF